MRAERFIKSCTEFLSVVSCDLSKLLIAVLVVQVGTWVGRPRVGRMGRRVRPRVRTLLFTFYVCQLPSWCEANVTRLPCLLCYMCSASRTVAAGMAAVHSGTPYLLLKRCVALDQCGAYFWRCPACQQSAVCAYSDFCVLPPGMMATAGEGGGTTAIGASSRARKNRVH